MRVSHLDKDHTIDDVMRLSLSKSIYHRLPWLVIGLFGGILASYIVGGFEKTLQNNIILASFIPLIVYMSDAVGTQMEAFVIRDLATQPKIHLLRYFGKQLIISVFIALILGLGLYVYCVFSSKNPIIALVLSISMFISITSSVFTGLLLPLLFRKINLDPANASAPIATIVQDILSVTIYFTTASLLL